MPTNVITSPRSFTCSNQKKEGRAAAAGAAHGQRASGCSSNSVNRWQPASLARHSGAWAQEGWDATVHAAGGGNATAGEECNSSVPRSCIFGSKQRSAAHAGPAASRPAARRGRGRAGRRGGGAVCSSMLLSGAALHRWCCSCSGGAWRREIRQTDTHVRKQGRAGQAVCTALRHRMPRLRRPAACCSARCAAPARAPPPQKSSA